MSEHCCTVFPKLALTFNWMSFVNDKNESILCMPYIEYSDIKYRINNCPSCGKEIRSVEIEVSKFSNF